MKKIKALFVAFILTCILSVSGVNAANYISFVGITLPAFSKEYTSDAVQKKEDNYQYSKTVSAIDLLSGDGRAISARVNGVGAQYVSVPKGTWVQLKDVNGLTTALVKHKIQIKATKSTVSKVSYSGRWAVDESARIN